MESHNICVKRLCPIKIRFLKLVLNIDRTFRLFSVRQALSEIEPVVLSPDSPGMVFEKTVA